MSELAQIAVVVWVIVALSEYVWGGRNMAEQLRWWCSGGIVLSFVMAFLLRVCWLLTHQTPGRGGGLGVDWDKLF